MKISWINFLHIYQPPTQTSEVVKKVSVESYDLILKLLETYPTFKPTINICGSLIELLEKNKRIDIVEKFKTFLDKGQIEIVGSAMYHPILALLPEQHIRRQIELNTAILKKYFGNNLKLRGFFIPEMAYSKKVADIVKDIGFEWLILDDSHFSDNRLSPNPSIKYQIDDNGLFVMFRNRLFSKTFPPEFIETNKEKINVEYLITAHDGELYGHWHKDDKGYYQKAFTDSDLEIIHGSDYLTRLQTIEKITPKDASWESLADELKNNIPYGLWNDPKNTIHQNLWKFAHTVIATVDSHVHDDHFDIAQKAVDRGLASCAWWWASEKIPAAFSPLTWNPTEIEKGAQELLNGVRSLKKLDASIRMDIEKKFNALRELIWQHHWQLQQ